LSWCPAVTLAALGVPFSAAAQSQVDSSVYVSANGGYSSNPFLSEGDDEGLLIGQVDVRPTLEWRNELDVIRLESFFTHAQYSEDVGSTDAAGTTLTASSRIDAQTTLRAVIAFDSSVLGVGDAVLARGSGSLQTPSIPSDPTAGEPPVTQPAVPETIETPDGDIDLIGSRQRRNSLSLAVSAEIRPDARSSWTIGANASGADYPGGNQAAAGYRTAGLSTNYRRDLSELTSLGARAEAYVADYKGGPTSKVYTLQAYTTRRLSQFWSLDAGAGASVIDGGDTVTLFSGQASLCNRQPLAVFCIVASREPAISGLSGVRTQTNIGANYQVLLDANSSLSGAASYAWTGADVQSSLGERRFLTLSTTYRRDVGRRFSIMAAVDSRYLQISGSQSRRDVALRLGGAFRFGMTR
jgi:hypothetical protein